MNTKLLYIQEKDINTAYRPDNWTLQILERTTQFLQAKHHQAYLVGGSVRNLLLQEPWSDWDIATTGEVARLARQLADELGGFFAHLHERASRVIVKHQGQEVILDLAPLHGNSIEEDLHARDFTINAMGIPLAHLIAHFTEGEPLYVVDPLHGGTDLEKRHLRAVNDQIFQHDPLRMLRAVRFMIHYQLSLEPGTGHLLSRDASLLPQAAPERVQSELYAILQGEHATQWLRLLDQHGLLTALIPEFIPARGMPQPGLHHWDVFDHSLETVAALERLAHELQQPQETLDHSPLNGQEKGMLAAIQEVLYEAEAQHIFHLQALTSPVMKLAALLHDIGKPATYTVDEAGEIRFYHHPQVGVPIAQEIMKRLHTSTHDRRLIQQIVAHHMRPGQLSSDTVTPRAVRRYFVDLGPTGIAVALTSLADHLAMRGPEPLTDRWERHLATVRLLLTRYIRERDRILPPRLIQTGELMRRLRLDPGPMIGQLLELIAEAQTEGRVHSKEEALWLAEEYLREQTAQPQDSQPE